MHKTVRALLSVAASSALPPHRHQYTCIVGLVYWLVIICDKELGKYVTTGKESSRNNKGIRIVTRLKHTLKAYHNDAPSGLCSGAEVGFERVSSAQAECKTSIQLIRSRLVPEQSTALRNISFVQHTQRPESVPRQVARVQHKSSTQVA